MNARIVRFVTGAVTAAVLSVMGAGLANASVADRLESQLAAATGQHNTHSVATYLGQLHDYLKAAAEQNDIKAVAAAIKTLRPVLGVVAAAPVERGSAVLSDRADEQAAQIERGLPGLTLLAPIAGLVTSLLTTLLDLVTGLLGGLPLPLPDVDGLVPDLGGLLPDTGGLLPDTGELLPDTGELLPDTGELLPDTDVPGVVLPDMPAGL